MFTVNKVWLDCKANKLRVSYTGDWNEAPEISYLGSSAACCFNYFYKGTPGEYNPDVIPMKVPLGLMFMHPWPVFGRVTNFSCCNKDFKEVEKLKILNDGTLEYAGPPLPNEYFFQFSWTDDCCWYKLSWITLNSHPDYFCYSGTNEVVPRSGLDVPKGNEASLFIWDKFGCPLYKTAPCVLPSKLFLNITYDPKKGIDYNHSPAPAVVIPELPPKGTKLSPGEYCFNIFQERNPDFPGYGITRDLNYLPVCKLLKVPYTGIGDPLEPSLECPLTLGKDVLVDKTIGCEAFIQNKSGYQITVKLLEALGFSDLCDPIEGFKESKLYKIPPGKSLKVPMGSSRYATKVVIEYTYGDKTCTLEKCIGFCESALRGKDKTPFPIVTKKVSMSKEDFIVFYNPIENGGVVLKLQSELAGNLPSSFTINPGESVGFSIDKFSSDTISYETSSKDYPKRKISSSTDLTSGEDITINNVHGILYGKKHMIILGSAAVVSSF